ncbi:helix-turn-helix domain-containing protein [Priestia megaterium]|uniref:helix-turn-helix domain-containing protein n=1 Tax=Priestia megaterium TaxID=1404 RepID=UPI0034E2E7FF
MEEILYSEIGNLIKKNRLLRKLTQEDLGNRVGLTRASITNIERGKQKISIHTLYLIADVLNISPQSLMPEPSALQKSEGQLPESLSEIKSITTEKEYEWIKNVIKKSKSDEGGE